jgi:hypothetical protein
MKKTCICFIILAIFLMFLVCISDTVKNGRYFMEKGTLCITISDGKYSLSDLKSSMLTLGYSGTYIIDNDMITMTTSDTKYIYVFQIDGDNLIFQKNESSPDSKIGDIADNAKFYLIN